VTGLQRDGDVIGLVVEKLMQKPREMKKEAT